MQSPVCLPQAYEVREVLSPLVIINETAGSENPMVLATIIQLIIITRVACCNGSIQMLLNIAASEEN